MSVCFKHLRITYSGVRKEVDGVRGHLWTARDCGDVVARGWLPNHSSKRMVVEQLTAYESLAYFRAKAEGKPAYFIQLP